MGEHTDKLTGKAAKIVRDNRDQMRATIGANSPIAVAEPPPRPHHQMGVQRDMDARLIPVDRIEADMLQPRTVFDENEIREKAETLRELGQIQAITVWLDEASGRWVIEDGERRWRAAKLAGLKELKCRVVPMAPPDVRLARQMVANLQRSDFNPIDMAAGFGRLAEMGWTQVKIAHTVGRSQETISRAISLLKLPASVRELVKEGKLAGDSARALLALESSDRIAEMAVDAISGDWSRERVRIAVRQATEPKPPAPIAPAEILEETSAEAQTGDFMHGAYKSEPADVMHGVYRSEEANPLEEAAPAEGKPPEPKPATAVAEKPTAGKMIDWQWHGEGQYLKVDAFNSKDGESLDLAMMVEPGEAVASILARADSLWKQARNRLWIKARFPVLTTIQVASDGGPHAGQRGEVVTCLGSDEMIVCEVGPAIDKRQRVKIPADRLFPIAPPPPSSKPAKKAGGRP